MMAISSGLVLSPGFTWLMSAPPSISALAVSAYPCARGEKQRGEAALRADQLVVAEGARDARRHPPGGAPRAARRCRRLAARHRFFFRRGERGQVDHLGGRLVVGAVRQQQLHRFGAVEGRRRTSAASRPCACPSRSRRRRSRSALVTGARRRRRPQSSAAWCRWRCGLRVSAGGDNAAITRRDRPWRRDTAACRRPAGSSP